MEFFRHGIMAWVHNVTAQRDVFALTTATSAADTGPPSLPHEFMTPRLRMFIEEARAVPKRWNEMDWRTADHSVNLTAPSYLLVRIIHGVFLHCRSSRLTKSPDSIGPHGLAVLTSVMDRRDPMRLRRVGEDCRRDDGEGAELTDRQSRDLVE